MSIVECYNRKIKGTFAEGFSSNQRVAREAMNSERRFEMLQRQQAAAKRKKGTLPLLRWEAYLSSPRGQEYLTDKRTRIEERVNRFKNGYDGYDLTELLAELRFLKKYNLF